MAASIPYAKDAFLNRTFYRYLFPTILSVLGGTVNVMADSVMVGNLLGGDGLAAITLCTPVYLLFCTMGSLVASGAGALASIALGKTQEQESRQYYTWSFLLMLLLGTAATAAGLMFLDPLVGLLGAKNATAALVRDYLQISILGCVFKMLLYLPFYFLRIDGRAKLVSVCLLVMTGLNILLNLLFMQGFGMGIRGAAVASVLSTLIAMLLGFVFLGQKISHFHFCRPACSDAPRRCLRILEMGSPAALYNLLSALRVAALNQVLMLAGGQNCVSLFAVVNSVSELSLCLINGVPQTTAPLVGMFSGEQDNHGIRILIRQQVLVGLGLIAVFSTLISLFSQSITGWFGLHPHRVETAMAFSCLAISLIAAMLNSILTYYYNSVGRVRAANLITVSRLLVMVAIPALYLQGDSIWLFFPVSEYGTLFFTLFGAWMLSLRNRQLSAVLWLDDSRERAGCELHVSIEDEAAQVQRAEEVLRQFCRANALSEEQTKGACLITRRMVTMMLAQAGRDAPSDKQSVDLRVFLHGEVLGLRLRSGGAEFDPITDWRTHENDPDMKANMSDMVAIRKATKKVCYQRSFGVNSLLILM